MQNLYFWNYFKITFELDFGHDFNGQLGFTQFGHEEPREISPIHSVDSFGFAHNRSPSSKGRRTELA
jgi:hypothetical protein